MTTRNEEVGAIPEGLDAHSFDHELQPRNQDCIPLSTELTLAQSAIGYANLGLTVHPLRPGTSLPILKGWPDLASSDPTTVREWWDEYPNANVGILTGTRSGLLVIDVDVKNDPNGVSGYLSLIDWERDHPDIDFSASVLVRTPSGSAHLIFRLVEPLDSKIGWLPDVDLLADRRFIVAPPSTRVVNGYEREYQVLRGSFDVIPMAPVRLLSAIRGSRGGSSTRHGSASQREVDKLPRLASFLEHGFRVGSRDIDCYRLSCYLWRMHWGDDELVEAIICEIWMKTDQTPTSFGWDEAKAKLVGARNYVGTEIAQEREIMKNFMGGAK